MPISDYHRLIFIHIPKNAGTALEQSLMTRKSGHNHWQTYQQKYSEEWNNYTSFAVLRDPISRFVSCYNYARMDKSHWHSSDPGTKSIYGKHPDFEICKCYTINEMVALIFRGEATLEHPGWRPQHPWINNNGRIAVDYLVDFARLGAAMKLLSPDIDIRRVNASSSDSESILEEESILMLREIYKEDYSLTKLLGESEGGLIPEASNLTIHGKAAKSKIFRLSELPIFCVSLEGATARRNTVIQMNQALRLGIRIIDAVDGRNVTRDQIQTHTKIPIKWNSLNGDRDEISTPTAAACSISHIRLWEMIVKESIEQAIIIEDDATCERDHQLKIPNDAEFVYL
jgi:hypothetical protein